MTLHFQLLIINMPTALLQFHIIFHVGRKVMSVIRVLVSGAAGNIGYAILPMIVRTFSLLLSFSAAEMSLVWIKQVVPVSSHIQPIDLVLLDIQSCMGKLDGVEMALNDCAYPLVKSLVILDH